MEICADGRIYFEVEMKNLFRSILMPQPASFLIKTFLLMKNHARLFVYTAQLNIPLYSPFCAYCYFIKSTCNRRLKVVLLHCRGSQAMI